RQVIEMALANPNIEITAIDLSPASLTFARQMAQRYEADNITFELLDILDVEKLGQKFDYILCTGVLHHMASPQAGLNALSKVVSADGIMLLGFYSKLGRQELAGIKQQALDYLDVEASQITTQGVRQWRGNLSMDVAKNTPWYKVQDFFNLNGLFDLLFHPQEQAYELPQLAQMLDIAGVNFEWMAISNQQKAQYKQPLIENPTPDKSEAMAFWHQFESQHPAFFNGMFNFVVSPK
ncbi:MAG: SAM-dependent methyltransferase, partial [Phenylobacterium sp.]